MVTVVKAYKATQNNKKEEEKEVFERGRYAHIASRWNSKLGRGLLRKKSRMKNRDRQPTKTNHELHPGENFKPRNAKN